MLLPQITQDARLIGELYNFIYIFSILTFLLVEGLLIWTAVRYRRRLVTEMPAQVHGNNLAELTWTVLPAVLVAVIFMMTVNTMSQLTASGSLTNPIAHVHAIGDREAQSRVERAQKVDLVIEVTGKQWFWAYDYTDYDGLGAFGLSTGVGEELMVPAGKNIRLDMTSDNVIHAWWVPAFGGMRYVNPGDRSYVWFNVPDTGKAQEFFGQCNVFCGKDHALMVSKIKVLPELEFRQWYSATAVARNLPPDFTKADPVRGKELLTGGVCASCHLVAGTKAQGRVAPRELTLFATYPTLAQLPASDPRAAINQQNLYAWLKNPAAVKPGTAMPNNKLSNRDAVDLVAYLLTLK